MAKAKTLKQVYDNAERVEPGVNAQMATAAARRAKASLDEHLRKGEISRADHRVLVQRLSKGR